MALSPSNQPLCYIAQAQGHIFVMARFLPVDHATGRVAKLVGLITGFAPNCRLKDFPLEPEMAISKQATFLSVWFAEKPTKPEARLSFQTACPELPVLERNEIIQHLGQYRQWLKKKAHNMKNGDKTSPAVLQVMKAMDLAPMASEPQPQPHKRLKRKTSMTSQPDKATPPVAPQPAMAAIQNHQPEEDQPEKAPTTKSKILMLQGSSPKSNMETSANEEKEASVVSTQEISSTSFGIVSPEKLEGSVKSGGCKRPASCKTPKKKPAMAPKTAKVAKPAKAVHMATQNTWVASCSFGWLKKGSYKEKGYIQARNGSESKAYCLVNVNLPQGQDQTKVLEACFAEAQKANLDKAHMVNFKNGLLKQL